MLLVNGFSTSLAVVLKNCDQKKIGEKTTSLIVRCEQSTKGGGGINVWLGRLAMIGFATAISVEVATGKGLLEVI